jgi:hypothetical protein
MGSAYQVVRITGISEWHPWSAAESIVALIQWAAGHSLQKNAGRAVSVLRVLDAENFDFMCAHMAASVSQVMASAPQTSLLPT